MYQQNPQQQMTVNWLFTIDKQHDDKVSINLLKEQSDYKQTHQGKISNDIAEKINTHQKYIFDKYLGNGVSIDQICKNFDIYIKEDLLNTFNFIFNLMKKRFKNSKEEEHGFGGNKTGEQIFKEYKNEVKTKLKEIIDTQNIKHTDKEKSEQKNELADKEKSEQKNELADKEKSEQINKTKPEESIKQLKQQLNNLKVVAEQTVASLYSCCTVGTSNLLKVGIFKPTPEEVTVPNELTKENESLNAIFQTISDYVRKFDSQIEKIDKNRGAKFKKGFGLGDTGCVVQ